MNVRTRLVIAPALLALVLGTAGCGQPQAPGASPASTSTTSSTTEPAEETASEPAEETASEPVEETASEPVEDGLMHVDPEPAWSVEGASLIDVFGDIVVVSRVDGDGTMTLDGLTADGAVAWTRVLDTPAQLADAEGTKIFAVRGWREVLVAWTGDLPETGLLVSGWLDPATGEIRATGELEVPRGSETGGLPGYGLDQFWVSATGSSALVTVAQDGSMTAQTPPTGVPPVLGSVALTHDRGVAVGEGGHVQLVDLDGPIGEGATCWIPESPGPQTVSAFSPDRNLALVPGATVDLVDGTVTCWPRNDTVSLRPELVADDGTLVGVVTAGGNHIGVFRMQGGVLSSDAEAIELLSPRGGPDFYLSGGVGELVIGVTSDGVTAHRITG